MTVYISRDESNAELTHYGVKGMKWRKHKASLMDNLNKAGEFLGQMGDAARTYFNIKDVSPIGYSAPTWVNRPTWTSNHAPEDLKKAKSKGKDRMDHVLRYGIETSVMRGLGTGKKRKVHRKSNGKIDYIEAHPSKKEIKAVRKWNKKTNKRLKNDTAYVNHLKRHDLWDE